jgi:hypothetical protein
MDKDKLNKLLDGMPFKKIDEKAINREMEKLGYMNHENDKQFNGITGEWVDVPINIFVGRRLKYDYPFSFRTCLIGDLNDKYVIENIPTDSSINFNPITDMGKKSLAEFDIAINNLNNLYKKDCTDLRCVGECYKCVHESYADFISNNTLRADVKKVLDAFFSAVDNEVGVLCNSEDTCHNNASVAYTINIIAINNLLNFVIGSIIHAEVKDVPFHGRPDLAVKIMENIHTYSVKGLIFPIFMYEKINIIFNHFNKLNLFGLANVEGIDISNVNIENIESVMSLINPSSFVANKFMDDERIEGDNKRSRIDIKQSDLDAIKSGFELFNKLFKNYTSVIFK